MKHQLLLASLFACLMAVGTRVFGVDDPLLPRIPMVTPTKVCPVSILVPSSLKKPCGGTPEFPELRGCKGVWIGSNCSEWSKYAHATLELAYYQLNLEHNDFARTVRFDLFHEPFDQFVHRGGGGDFLRSSDEGTAVPDSRGIPQLSSSNLVGACGQEKGRKIEVAPISGQNWSGWIWEQSFDLPKKKLTDSHCQKFTPDYRCVTFAFGNDKMSAIFPTYCFLRKKVDNLDVELSFDVFMDMVKTIRFNEGEIIGQPSH